MMEEKLKYDIISLISKEVEKSGSCSIKQAAEKLFYHNISFSEQKQIAKHLVKEYHFITDVKDKEVIVKQNIAYLEAETKTDYSGLIKTFVWLLVALLSYLVFKVFLPSLNK